jgi:hypothetical protein
MRRSIVATSLVLSLFSVASADVLQTYEDQSEGFKGQSWSYQGVTFRDVNNVNGFFPDGSPMTPNDLGREVIVEQANPFYVDFPEYGSPVNSLTFGSSFVVGQNLSIGALASVWMDLDQPASSAEFDIGYYENGPWGGIEYRLDALNNGQVVGAVSFTISNLGGRDNPTFDHMAVAAGEFDQLHLYATFNGSFTGPRGMIDNLSLTAVPEPSIVTSSLLAAGAVIARRRRR